MKWWDQMPWSLSSACWALSQVFHCPLSLSSRGSLCVFYHNKNREVYFTKSGRRRPTLAWCLAGGRGEDGDYDGAERELCAGGMACVKTTLPALRALQLWACCCDPTQEAEAFLTALHLSSKPAGPRRTLGTLGHKSLSMSPISSLQEVGFIQPLGLSWVPMGRFQQLQSGKGGEAERREAQSRNNSTALGQGPGSHWSATRDNRLDLFCKHWNPTR